jgi:hypothetical protein
MCSISYAIDPQYVSRSCGRMSASVSPWQYERRVAGRVAPARVEAGGEVPVHPVGLDEGHRRGDRPQERLVGLRGLRDRSGRGRRRDGRGGRDGGGPVSGSVAAEGKATDSLGERKLLEELLGSGLEERPPRGIDRVGRGQVLDEELLDVTEVEVSELRWFHLG